MGGEGGGGGQEGSVGGGDVAMTERVTAPTEARRPRWRWWRWWWRRERVLAVKAEVERAACAGRKRGAPSDLMARAVGEREDEVVVDPCDPSTGNGPRLAEGHHEFRDAGADQKYSWVRSRAQMRCTAQSLSAT
eukprot:scaffold46131_cov29-Phaeocystis_antarctica.AAC.2